jgi:hypothetical protein
MRKPTPWLVLAAAILSVAGVAQMSSQRTPPPSGAYGETRNTSAVGTQLMTGTVWGYKPGQSITIKAGDGKEYEMPLTPGVRVDGSVAEGHLAVVMWTTDSDGKTRVMSITAAPGGASDIERSAPSVSGRPPATAVPNVTPAPGAPGPGSAASTTPRGGSTQTTPATATPKAR